MTKIVKDPGAPGNDAVPWGGTVKLFRIDPHEFTAQREFFFDDVKLAADDEANGSFAITWSAADPDDAATITLYRDTNDSGFDGVQIAGGIAHIFPGGFLKQATPGASYTYPFVMATYIFLADK